MTVQFKVSGKVTQSDRIPLASMTVRAFDKGLPSLGVQGEQQLGGDALTDAEGDYAITFAENNFNRGEPRYCRKVQPHLFTTDQRGDSHPQAVQPSDL